VSLTERGWKTRSRSLWWCRYAVYHWVEVGLEMVGCSEKKRVCTSSVIVNQKTTSINHQCGLLGRRYRNLIYKDSKLSTLLSSFKCQNGKHLSNLHQIHHNITAFCPVVAVELPFSQPVCTPPSSSQHYFETIATRLGIHIYPRPKQDTKPTNPERNQPKNLKNLERIEM
jgi:hypothetical protein